MFLMLDICYLDVCVKGLDSFLKHAYIERILFIIHNKISPQHNIIMVSIQYHLILDRIGVFLN